MNKREIVVGIDTSNYTTSVAWVDVNGQLLGHERQLLHVKEGERGLRQSEAVFQHVINLPKLFSRGNARYGLGQVVAVTASVQPRPVAGSYMPVFKVSEGLGQTLAEALQVPFIPTSHQEGHIKAGLFSANGPLMKEFLAVHLSGGTTEVLKVSRTIEQPAQLWDQATMEIEILGSSVDLHAGQLVDRVGVALGLPFPAGPHLEKLAGEVKELIKSIPSSVNGYNISFSGPETQAMRWITQGHEPSQVARAVEHCVTTSLEKVIRKALVEFALKQVLIVGGVAANGYLRRRLIHRLEHRAVGAGLYFAEPALSADNAVGVALIGAERYRLGKLGINQ